MPPKQLSFLPEIDAELTQQAMEEHFEKYRFYKIVGFEEREATITASYDPTPRSDTNKVSDQTANIAIYNVDTPRQMQEFCDRTEQAVSRLPFKQRLLIKEKYMNVECPFDYTVYNDIFQEKFGRAISATTYAKIRADAFYTLAFLLKKAVIKRPADIDISGKSKS